MRPLQAINDKILGKYLSSYLRSFYVCSMYASMLKEHKLKVIMRYQSNSRYNIILKGRGQYNLSPSSIYKQKRSSVIFLKTWVFIINWTGLKKKKQCLLRYFIYSMSLKKVLGNEIYVKINTEIQRFFQRHTVPFF